MSRISLNRFCKDRNIAVSTAHGRLKEAGFDTSRGLNADAQLFLIQSFKLNEEPEIKVVQAKVETVDTPQMSGALDLSRLHDSSLQGPQIEDPAMAVATAIQALKAISQQAGLATQQSFDELEEIRGLNASLKKQAEQTRQDMQEAKTKQYVLDVLKQSGQQELLETLQETQGHLSQG